MTLRVGPDEVIEWLERARSHGPSAMAFDADGTLWSGDVGEDVFEFAYENGLVREAARAELEHLASAHGVRTAGTPSDLARELHAAYRRGNVDERLTCEIMTWSYAGFTLEELRAMARSAFDRRGLAARVRAALAPIRTWAEREGVRVIVISASPAAVVTEALDFAGIPVFGVAGAVPEMDGDRILPRMAAPVPYAAHKRTAGLPLIGAHDWLASFGDNSFDVDLLRAARVRVAVFPKPALLERLGEIEDALVLE